MSAEAMASHRSNKLRALKMTASSRFAAAKRLQHHDELSTYSIAACSILIIVASLIEPFRIEISVPPNLLNFAIATSSLGILVLSLLASSNKFGQRAEKLHAGAIEINSLARRLEAAMHDPDDTRVEIILNQYEQTLKTHENHNDVDFFKAKFESYRKYYGINWVDEIKYYFLSRADFLPHLAAPGAIFVFLIFIVKL